MRGGAFWPRRELVVCCFASVLSLTIAAAFHRFAPGFGAIFKPLLWPLLILPFTVRPRYALVTSFAVPLISHILTGMPTLPVAFTLSAIAAGVTSALSAIAHRGRAHRSGVLHGGLMT